MSAPKLFWKITGLLVSVLVCVIIFNAVTADRLAQAAIDGNTKEASTLLALGIRVEGLDEFGVTPLMRAAEHNQLAMCRLLLSRGANINAVDQLGHSVLIHSIDGRNIETSRFLIQQGANINFSPGDRGGVDTPLTSALNKYDPDAVALLLDSGADVCQPDAVGNSPLTEAKFPKLKALIISYMKKRHMCR